MRAQVRSRSSQVPSPIAGIFAPLASMNCMHGYSQDRYPLWSAAIKLPTHSVFARKPARPEPVQWPKRRTPCRANGRSRQATPVPARAGRACPAPSSGSSPQGRRGGRRIRAGSGARGAAGRGLPAAVPPLPTWRRRIAGASGNSCPSRNSTIRPSAFRRNRCMINPRRESSAMRLKVRLMIPALPFPSPSSARTTASRCRETRRSRPRR